MVDLVRNINKNDKNLANAKNQIIGDLERAKEKKNIELNERTKIVISVVSAGFESENFAQITVDGESIECGLNENGTDRGLHLVIINPRTGMVEFKRVFDTYKN